MTVRKTPFLEGEYYHIYNRGNNKQKIFFSDEDKDHFVKLLYLCNSVGNVNFREDIVKNKIDAFDFNRGDSIVYMGAWVLMPNHFHLYITPSSNPGGLAKFVGRVCNAYTKYLNIKYGRTGSLFEGRYKSVHIKDETQAKYLFSYIHLNPIKLIQSDWKEKGINDTQKSFEFLRQYKWSSYQDYLDIKRKENKILNRSNFINYFDNPESFREEIFDWIIPSNPGGLAN